MCAMASSSQLNGGPDAQENPVPKPAPTRTSTAPASRPSIQSSESHRLTWSPSVRRTRSAHEKRLRPVAGLRGLSQLSIRRDGFQTEAHVSPRDGRVHVSLNARKDGPLAALLPKLRQASDTGVIKEQEDPGAVKRVPPKLNIVVQLIGSQGDIQPFIPIAKLLAQKWGHRVRLATHGAFREFIESNGIEFFDIGGDPAELMSFMVRNPGLIPSIDTIKAGDVQKRREQMAQMFQGFWKSCIEPNDGHEYQENISGAEDALASSEDGPFIADAIIANPPSFAHIHCAEKLGIPLHLMFTFPYSPTQEIPHPLAFIQNSNVASGYTNAVTYPMVEMMTWQGLGDIINRFRKQTLGLEPVATLWAPGMISRLKVPFSYMWSPALIPKPADWGPHIDITGFVFLQQANEFKPPDALENFLSKGPPPVYIGFGSIVVDDPDVLTDTIFSAIKCTGVRALVSKGWGGIGCEDDGIPENVIMLESTPHDWLFPRVSCVVHHGGAGTTAIGLKNGKPTMVVPFFGDQPFWGAMVANAGAGAEPVPHKELTSEKLADGIRKLLSEECQAAAGEISRKINEDDGDGAENAVRSFFKGIDELRKGHRGLEHVGLVGGEGGPRGPPQDKWGVGGPGLRCSMVEDKVAVWRIRRTRTKLSALAAYCLLKSGKLSVKELRLVRHTEWNDFEGPGEPVTGGFSAFFCSIANMAKGFVGVPYTWYKGAKRIDGEGIEVPDELKPSSSLGIVQSKRKSKKPSERHDGYSNGSISTDTDWETDDIDQSSQDSGSENHPKHRHSIGHDLAHGTRRSIIKIGRAGARAPLDVSLAVAQGFHNAPRLYGDKVRRPYRVTGFHSGVRAAGKEFALGMYDGITGIVMQPYHGARKEGIKGFAKGFWRGIGGAFLKPSSGLTGIVGFSLKGVHKELRKKRDRRWSEQIKRARIAQGERDLAVLKKDEYEEVKAKIEEGWIRVLEERKNREENVRFKKRITKFARRQKDLRDKEGRKIETTKDKEASWAPRREGHKAKEKVKDVEDEKKIEEDEEGKA